MATTKKLLDEYRGGDDLGLSDIMKWMNSLNSSDVPPHGLHPTTEAEMAETKAAETKTRTGGGATKPSDTVNHPSHYCFGSIEVIDYIRSTLGDDGCYNYCMGNVIKYISRAKHKGKWCEDLEKATWYLNYAKTIAATLSVAN